MLIIVLYALASFVYLFLGVYALFIDYRSRLYRVFFYYSLTFVLWSFSHIFMASGPQGDNYLQWLTVGNIGMIIQIPVALHLMLVFSKRLRRTVMNYLVLPAIYIPPVLFVFYCSLFKTITISDIPINAWHGYYLLFYTFYAIPGFISIIQWARKSRLVREKRQAMIIIALEAVIVSTGTLVDIVLPFLGLRHGPMMTPIIMLLWFIGIYIVAVKYRVIITPQTVSMDIVSGIDESILLLDGNGMILMVNRRSEQLLGIPGDRLRGKDISVMMVEHESVKNEIAKMKESQFDTFSARVHYLKGEEGFCLMDIKASTLYDTMGGMSGILITGSKVKELSQLKTDYQITEREVEIINHIISGIPNRKIAEHLGIAERTVKSHITNIYNKLVIDNKMQLLNLLKDYNLYPEKSAEKRLIILNKN